MPHPLTPPPTITRSYSEITRFLPKRSSILSIFFRSRLKRALKRKQAKRYRRSAYHNTVNLRKSRFGESPARPLKNSRFSPEFHNGIIGLRVTGGHRLDDVNAAVLAHVLQSRRQSNIGHE